MLLAACSPADQVVVYASFEDKTYLPALFDTYTKETGTIVIVRQGKSQAIVEDVIENEIAPPADVLLTPSVRGIYRAAEEGALRPIPKVILEKNVPLTLRDPDGLWAALTYRNALIVYDPEVVATEHVAGVESLAKPEFRGQLCLSSSSNSNNLTVIAGLIDTLGLHDAELTVRGWVANLARLPFETESKLLGAIETGDCGIGVISSQSAGEVAGKLATYESALASVDIEGIGIARHARNPDGALRLVEWFLSDRIQERHAAFVSSHPVIGDFQGGKSVGLVAWLNDDAIKLAERARYR
jgi:iron(III) transport system substrate-binding protein